MKQEIFLFLVIYGVAYWIIWKFIENKFIKEEYICSTRKLSRPLSRACWRWP